MGRKIRVISAAIIGILAVSALLLMGFSRIQRQNTAIRYQSIQNEKDKENIERSETITNDTNEDDTIAEDTSAQLTSGSEYAYKKNDQLEWLNINDEYVGWLNIEGTNINYPVVRGMDNQKYLTTDFFNKKSDAGALFMDYRNLAQFNDRHTVIYGHYMKDGSMFHNLHLYKEESYHESHDVITLQGLYETRTYEIFSVYIESANDYELNLDALNENYANYLGEIKSRSMFDYEISPSLDDNILTLVTCSYEVDNGRMIVHAVELP